MIFLLFRDYSIDFYFNGIKVRISIVHVVVQRLPIEFLTKGRAGKMVSASVLSILTFKSGHRSKLSSEQWQGFILEKVNRTTLN